MSHDLKAMPSPAKTIAKAQAKASREALELELKQQLRQANIQYEEQFTLPGLNQRWDVCLRPWGLLLEVQGGTWINGKHNRGQGYQDDCTKARLAMLRGWKTIWLTAQDVHSGIALRFVQDYIKVYPPF
jgi:hypothetical protein